MSHVSEVVKLKRRENQESGIGIEAGMETGTGITTGTEIGTGTRTGKLS